MVDYLLHHGEGASLLRIVMMKFFCYTTVFNAIELFSLTRNVSEARAVTSAMSAMKILGLNAKRAEHYGRWFASHRKIAPLNLLVAGMCLESKLPLVTGMPESFRGVHGLLLVKGSTVDAASSAAEILSRAETL